MAVSRVFSRSHLLLRAGASCVRVTPSAIPSISSSLPRRAFTSSAQTWEDIVQTPSRGPEISLTDNRSESAGNTANSIALLKISRRLSRGEIEEFLKSRGFNAKKVQLRVDRFSFQNDTNCFVELGSAEEAQKAVQELNRSKLHQHQIVVAPLKHDFRWGSVETPGRYGSRYFINEGNAAEEALRPLMEGRRVILSVETPGWTPELGIRDSRNKGMEIIAENFDQYGIERVSDLSVFYGDKKAHPRMLCSIDFKTKEGAEQAAADKHNAVINGRVVWVKSSEPSPWRVQQFWKTAPKIVEEMQEKGLLSKDMYEDKFTNPLPKKDKKSKQ